MECSSQNCNLEVKREHYITFRILLNESPSKDTVSYQRRQDDTRNNAVTVETVFLAQNLQRKLQPTQHFLQKTERKDIACRESSKASL